MLSLYHRIAKKSICNRGEWLSKDGMTKEKNYDKIIGAGEVSEWLKEHAWKACSLARGSQVRILFSPPSLEVLSRRFSFLARFVSHFEKRKRLSNTPRLGSKIVLMCCGDYGKIYT